MLRKAFGIHIASPATWLGGMSKPAPARYRTLNWSAYNASLHGRGSLTVWFDPGMAWHTAPSGRRGRQQTFSDAAIQACLTIKVLFGLPLRQTTGSVASLLKLAELDWPVPDHSTLCRRQKTLAVQLPCRGSAGPLHLLVDNEALSAIGQRTMPNGIKVRGEGEWHARKHGGARRRVWRKVHLAVDEATLEVRAVEITASQGGDAPMLPDLLGQISADEPIASGEPRERRRRLRHARLPRYHRGPGCRGHRPTPAQRQAMEEGQPRGVRRHGSRTYGDP